MFLKGEGEKFLNLRRERGIREEKKKILLSSIYIEYQRGRARRKSNIIIFYRGKHYLSDVSCSIEDVPRNVDYYEALFMISSLKFKLKDFETEKAQTQRN